jgi:hypothetical protein
MSLLVLITEAIIALTKKNSIIDAIQPEKDDRDFLERFNSFSEEVQEHVIARLQVLSIQEMLLPRWRRFLLSPRSFYRHYKISRKNFGIIDSIIFGIRWTKLTLFVSEAQ